jgi:hypothetical protein
VACHDKNAVIALLLVNPLRRDSTVNKGLSKKPKPPPSGVPVFKPWKPAQPAKLQLFKPRHLLWASLPHAAADCSDSDSRT